MGYMIMTHVPCHRCHVYSQCNYGILIITQIQYHTTALVCWWRSCGRILSCWYLGHSWSVVNDWVWLVTAVVAGNWCLPFRYSMTIIIWAISFHHQPTVSTMCLYLDMWLAALYPMWLNISPAPPALVNEGNRLRFYTFCFEVHLTQGRSQKFVFGRYKSWILIVE